jgi:hypothetical protein
LKGGDIGLDRPENPTCTIKWSEFHYHFFSWLIDENTDRSLAMGIELQIFKRSYLPDEQLLNEYVDALIDSEEPEDFVRAATEIYTKYNV